MNQNRLCVFTALMIAALSVPTAGQAADPIDEAAASINKLLVDRRLEWIKFRDQPDPEKLDPLLVNAAWRSVEPEVIQICEDKLKLDGTPQGEFPALNSFQANNFLFEEAVMRVLAPSHQTHTRWETRSREQSLVLPVLGKGQHSSGRPNYPRLREQINQSLQSQGFNVEDRDKVPDPLARRDANERFHCRTATTWIMLPSGTDQSIKRNRFRWRVIFQVNRVDGERVLATESTKGDARIALTSYIEIGMLGKSGQYDPVLTTGPAIATSFATKANQRESSVANYSVSIPIGCGHLRGQEITAEQRKTGPAKDRDYALTLRTSPIFLRVRQIQNQVTEAIKRNADS